MESRPGLSTLLQIPYHLWTGMSSRAKFYGEVLRPSSSHVRFSARLSTAIYGLRVLYSCFKLCSISPYLLILLQSPYIHSFYQ